MRIMRNWTPRALLASWVAWWLALAIWGIGPAIPVMWRVSQPDGKGSANVSFGDGGFHATISEGARTTWQGDISFLRLILLAGIPPLLLWIVWAWGQKRPDPGDPDLLTEGPIELGRKGRRGRRAKKTETNDIYNPFV